MNSIDFLLSPRSIAVVGASNRPGSVGAAIFKNLLCGDFKGVLFPVHPTEHSVQSIRAYSRLTDIPDEVDMAVIIVPTDKVEGVIRDAAEKGIRGCIVITAGFKEVGGRGAEAENRLKGLIADCGIRMVGPNCLGVINTDPVISMNASFAKTRPMAGNIAFISQSGALCTSVLDFAAGRNIGFSKVISFGNKMDVNEIDLLEYLKNDPHTDVMLMYLEDITDTRAFMEISRNIINETGKPILAVKSGRSAEGARAASSHTGALAGSDVAYDAIFKQSGIQRVEGINELFHYALAFSRQPIPKGNRIAIVTNAGGPGIMGTDAAIRHGLKLAEFSEATKQRLAATLPPTASCHNPVDIIGDANHERYESAIRDVLADDNVDGAIVILSPQAMINILETAMVVPRVAKETDKPVLTCFMGLTDVGEGTRYLESHGIPNYLFPEAAARSMAAMVRFGKSLKLRDNGKRLVQRFPVQSGKAGAIIREKLENTDAYYMPENEMSEVLACYGFPLLKSRLVTDLSEIDTAIEAIGLPVAMKIMSQDIVHKSDAGGVCLKIKTPDQARKTYALLLERARQYKPDARINGVLVEQMAKKGVEVILGATRDPKFGPMCMFGLGGIFVEALKDVTFRLAPMWELSAENMIRSIKAYNVLKGVRGNPPSDINAIRDCILRLSQMVSDHPEISELDINPLIVYPDGQGCVVADGRIILKKNHF